MKEVCLSWNFQSLQLKDDVTYELRVGDLLASYIYIHHLAAEYVT